MIYQQIHDFLGKHNLELDAVDLFGFSKSNKAKVSFLSDGKGEIPNFQNEFWTAKQRKSSSLHEISYRACFKAELPRFFIELLTKENDVIYDPFSGRGTTVIEAALNGRKIICNDVNPLSKILTEPRLELPKISEVLKRLEEIEIDKNISSDLDLSMFYEKQTLQEILSLKDYLEKKRADENEDAIDRWIRMVATNRLTGHSSGFFSVYTLPPNQAISAKKQSELNEKHKRTPQYRDTKAIILKKTKTLLKNVSLSQKTKLQKAAISALFVNESASNTKAITDNSVNLIVTSPPFLDVINYAADNWLRCWFNGINLSEVEQKISTHKKLSDWSDFISSCFTEFYRVIKSGGYVAFEVGEVCNGKIKLEDHVLPIGLNAGFRCIAVIINSQNFTKTSNIWGVSNNEKGTNSNRIILFQKP
jgi:DNA modification methylase